MLTSVVPYARQYCAKLLIQLMSDRQGDKLGLAPAGMIFIPCKDGISHNEIEDAKPEHITAGCNVLLHAKLERAGVVG